MPFSKEQLGILFAYRPDRLSFLSLERLVPILNKLSHNQLGYFITNKQLRGLDWTKLEPEQIRAILAKYEKVALLSKEQLEVAIPHLSRNCLEYAITNKQIQELDWTKLEPEQIRAILCFNSREKMALLSIDQLKSILPHFSEHLRSKITKEQWVELNK